MTNQTTNTAYEGRVGTAYGFCNADAPITKVQKDIEKLASQLPRETQSKLELELADMATFRATSKDLQLLQDIDNVPAYPTFPSGAKKLKEQLKPTRLKDLKYVITARYAPGTNEDAGNALCHVMNGLFKKYGRGKLYTGQIIGKAPNGEYVSWENE